MTANFLLIGDPQASWSLALENALASLGRLQIISDKGISSEILKEHYHLIIVDATVIEEETLFTLVSDLHNQKPDTRIVIATALPTWRRAREALRAGAADYIPKPENAEELLLIIKDLLSRPSPNRTNSSNGRFLPNG